MSTTPSPYLSVGDTLLWDLDRDPRFNATGGSLMVFDRPPEWECFLAKMERVTRLQPLLRRRIVEPPLGLATPRWVVVDDFDVADHLERVVVPPPGDMRTVLDLAAIRVRAPFDTNRPLWRFTMFEGLADGRAALLQLAHHAYSDGIGGMQLAQDYFDPTRKHRVHGPMPAAPPPEHLDRVAFGREAIAHSSRQAWRATVGTARIAARLARRGLSDPQASARDAAAYTASALRVMKPVTHTASPIMVERSVARRFDVFDVDFDDLRRAAKTVGATVNDAFLTAIGTGIRRYHDEHGAPVEHLRVWMPISIRRADDPRGGNRAGAAHVEIPVDGDDVAARLTQVRDASHAARGEPAVDLARILGAAVARLPAPVMVPVMAEMLVHCDVLASNIPGFPQRPYLCGARVDRWYALGPTEGTALGVFLRSHAGRCCSGVTSDRAAVPDPDLLVACLREGFESVLAIGETETSQRPEKSERSAKSATVAAKAHAPAPAPTRGQAAQPGATSADVRG